MINYTFDTITALDYFKKLLDEREDFLKNPTSSRHAINAAITGWHLYEWVYHQYRNHPYLQKFKKPYDYRDYLVEKESCFAEIRDLADGGKHYRMKDKHVLHTKIIKAGESIGQQVYNEDTLIVRFKFANVGCSITFDDVLYIVTTYWYELFSKEFKEDLSFFTEDKYTFF